MRSGFLSTDASTAPKSIIEVEAAVCSVNLYEVGCFYDKTGDRALPALLLTARDRGSRFTLERVSIGMTWQASHAGLRARAQSRQKKRTMYIMASNTLENAGVG
ncbi:hypothetical protein OS493_000961 [Desmophyllum pertusum]|uniref:Uncharacterized protein n=1 Tax=Desmophyllum pertusum TaxID=174260 RepID=A0A9X0D5V0_9CNID|nr:hypothetical protein OS493_000961 [Desmophyllum pertusum]